MPLLSPGGCSAGTMAEEALEVGTARRGHSDYIQSLDRGLAVLRAFGPERSALTLSDVARVTGLTRAAARRFLLTLVELGYVTTDHRLFSLSPRVLELGYSYLSGLGLTEIAVPHMEELVAVVQESSSIAVLDGDDIVYVVRVPTKRIMTVSITVGTRFPAYSHVDGPGPPGRAVRGGPRRVPGPRRARRADAEDGDRPGAPAGRRRGDPQPAATASSTRSWRTGCARWRSRSSTAGASPSRRSTSRRTRAGFRSRNSAPGTSARSWRPPRGSMRTCRGRHRRGAHPAALGDGRHGDPGRDRRRGAGRAGALAPPAPLRHRQRGARAAQPGATWSTGCGPVSSSRARPTCWSPPASVSAGCWPRAPSTRASTSSSTASVTGSTSPSWPAAARITVYGQQEVVKDLIAARLGRGRHGPLRGRAPSNRTT